MATYPWLTYSDLTRERQQEINTLALINGRCPPLLEDGKLGPGTCSSAKVYSKVSAPISAMLSSCQSYNDAAALTCFKLPVGVKSANTLTLQRALNNILVPQGFCKISEDGVLGAETGAAAKQVLGETVARKIGCTTFGMLKTCSAASTPSGPIAPVPSVPSEATPTPVAPPTPATPSTPSAETTTPIVVGPSRADLEKKCTDSRGVVDGDDCVWSEDNYCDLKAFAAGNCLPNTDITVSKKPASVWPWLIGAGVLAVGAGTFVAMKRKKK